MRNKHKEDKIKILALNNKIESIQEEHELAAVKQSGGAKFATVGGHLTSMGDDEAKRKREEQRRALFSGENWSLVSLLSFLNFSTIVYLFFLLFSLFTFV